MKRQNIFLLVFLGTAYYALATNPVLNPGFEMGTTNWNPLGSCTISASTVEMHSGNNSCLIENRSQAWNGPIQSIKNNIQQGIFYEFTAWAKVKEPLSIPLEDVGYFTITLKLDPVSGSNTYPQIGVVKVYKTGWIKIRGYYRFDSPIANYDDILVDIQGPDSAVDFYVDDINIESPLTYTAPSSSPSDFVRASGRDLVVGAGNTPIKLQGTNFWAYSDDLNDDAMEVVFNSYQYDWTDYAKVAALGYNCVRLNMDFRAFEDDSNPYTYKQEGWEWLEKNIIFAKNNGLYLLLDMHTPQGGYQSYGFTGDFWGNDAAAIANRNRLTELWKAIATRYKDEPAIAAYDLINEALVPSATAYYNYLQSLINAIRLIDPNHLINIEQSFSDAVGEYPHQLLAGGNIMYDTHYYYKWTYASQLIPAYGGGNGGNYPNAGTGFDKSDLETSLLDGGLQFCIDNNVPHNESEFGLSKYIFPMPTKGAVTWMTDLYDLHNTHKVSAQQWTWHSSAWGLYTNLFGFPDEDYIVPELENFLQNNNTGSFPTLAVDYHSPLQAVAENMGILLTWASANEENNDYFVIERSLNAKDWQNMGQINSKGNAASYEIYDKAPQIGQNFYRIQQVDFDGKFTYSHIVVANWQKEDSNIRLYPNPFSSSTKLTFSNAQQIINQYQLYNSAGKLLSTISHILTNSIEIKRGNLPEGLYFIKVISQQGEVFVLPLLIE